MTIHRTVAGVAVGLLAGAVALGVACTPAQQRAAREIVPLAVEAGCVLVRAMADDGSWTSVCATVDDLAPLLEQILSEREAREERARRRAEAVPVARVAFAFSEVPRARVPRRRCVSWVTVGPRVGAVDGGTDGGR